MIYVSVGEILFYGSTLQICIDSKVTGAREFVRVSRDGKPDDLLNSAIGGFGSGAILGRLQGQGSQVFSLHKQPC